MQDVRLNASRRQKVCGIDDARGLGSGADERDVAAVADDDSPTGREFVFPVKQALGRVADEPDVDRAVVAGRPSQDLLGLDIVPGGDRDHAGHRPHDRKVIHDEMRLAGDTGEEAGVAAADLDVQAGLGDEDPDLVERAHHGEGDERADERHEPRRGQPRCHTEHVLLGDAHLEKAIRIGLRKDIRLGRASRVGVEHDDPRVVSGQLGNRQAEDVAQRATHRKSHAAPPVGLVPASPRSAIAVANSSSVSTRVCHW